MIAPEASSGSRVVRRLLSQRPTSTPTGTLRTIQATTTIALRSIFGLSQADGHDVADVAVDGAGRRRAGVGQLSDSIELVSGERADLEHHGETYRGCYLKNTSALARRTT